MRKNNKLNLGIILFFIVIISSNLVFAQISLINKGPITSSEHLHFKSCVEGAGVRHSAFCYDDNRLVSFSTIDWEDGCKLSSIDLEEFKCSDIELQSTYTQGGISRKSTLRVFPEKTLSDPTNIINSQSWDGGWNSASNTAYAMWILSNYGDEYSRQIEEGLEWLKSNRLEREKCWTLGNNVCSIYETSRTLLFLKFAGINMTERVYQDAIMWLDSRMNYIDNNEWELRINPSSNGNCTVIYDGSQIFNGEVERNSALSIPFRADYEKLINITCEGIGKRVNIYDSEGRNIFYNYFERNSDDFFDYKMIDDSDYSIGNSNLYRIPPPCWSAGNKWSYCNRKTTLYTLLLDEFSDEKTNLAKKWLEEELRFGLFVGKYLSTEDSIKDTAMMLYKFEFSDENNKRSLREWLVHRQNNDGSWGNDINEKVVATGFAIMALKNVDFPGKDQVVRDGINWLSINYPKSGWDDFELEAISFLILTDTARPFLKTTGLPLKLQETISKKIYNPTGFTLENLKYDIKGNIEGKIRVEGDNKILPFNENEIKISPILGKAGTYEGIIDIKSDNLSVLKIPLSFQEESFLELKLKTETIHIFSENGVVTLSAKTNDEFDCDITWPQEVNSRNSISISNSEEIDIDILVPTISGEYSVNFSCANNQKRYELSFPFNVIYYDHSPISLSRSRIRINRVGRNESVEVKNNLNIPIDVEVLFDEEPFSLTLGARFFQLQPKESRDVDIINLAIAIENVTTEENTNILFRTLGEEESVAVSLRILPEGHKRFSFLRILFYLILLFAFIYGVKYYFLDKKNKDKEEEQEKPKEKNIKEKWEDFRKDLREMLPDKYKKLIKKSKAEIQEENEKIKKEIEKSHLKDMVVVMKKLNKSDEEISEKLTKEGLNQDEVKEVLSVVNIEQKLKSDIKQEQEAMKIVKLLDGNADIKELLLKKGFSKNVINNVFEELEHEIENKEKELKNKNEGGK